jgi:glycosyltransferase 2 family protein
MNRFFGYLVLAILVGTVFLWLAAKDLPIDQVGIAIANADKGRVAVALLFTLLIYTLAHTSRVLRWYYLVRPLGDVDARTVHRVGFVGTMAILIFPLRLGEFVRPVLLSKRTGLPASAGLGTAVVERVVDGLVVTGVLFVTLLTHKGSDPEAARALGVLSAMIFLPAFGVCLLALWKQEWALEICRRCLGWIPGGIADKVTDLLSAFIDGFGGLISGRFLTRFLGLTLLYWVTNAMSIWVLGRFGFGFDLSLWNSFGVLAFLAIGIMVPGGPGMAGNFEYFMMQAMNMFLSSTETSGLGVQIFAFAALLHILQFAVIVVPGLVVMWSDPDTRNLIRLTSEKGAQTG